MTPLSSIALSGMNAAQQQLHASANNVANANTPGYRRQEAVQKARPEGGVTTEIQRGNAERAALEADLVAQLQAKNAYLANMSVFRTADRMAGALLDKMA